MYCKFDDVVIVHIVGTDWNPDNGKQDVIIAIEKTGFYSLRSDKITWEALSLLTLASQYKGLKTKSSLELGISFFCQCGRIGQ